MPWWADALCFALVAGLIGWLFLVREYRRMWHDER